MDSGAAAAEDALVSLAVRPAAAAATVLTAVLVVLAATASAGGRDVLTTLTLPLAFAAAGVVALDRRPRAIAAASLAAVGVLHLVAFVLTAGAVIARRRDLVVLEVAAAAGARISYLLGFVAFLALALSLPHRTSLSPRSRRALVTAAAVAVAAPALGALLADEQRLPLELTGWPRAVAGAGAAPGLAGVTEAGALLLAAPVIGALILLWRYRKASVQVRRRLRWPLTALVVVMAAVVVGQTVGRDLPGAGGDLFVVIALGATPFAVLPSILGDPAEDERLAAGVRVAVVLAAAWSAIAIGYAAVAAGAGLAGEVRRPVATALVLVLGLAPLLPPVRRLVTRAADRLVFGPDVDGHALLTEYGAGVALASGLPGLCHHTAAALRTALGAPWAQMLLMSGEDETAGEPGPPAALRVPVVDGATVIGELRCGRRRRGPYSPRDVAAVAGLARHTALAVRNLRLDDELAARLDELAASRHRLAVAAETERRRIERDLHDGVQQDLVALLSRVELARIVLDFSVEETTRTLDELREDVRRAIVSLRRTVLGIHPPVLSDRGLVAAVLARSGDLPIDVDVQADAEVRQRRFPQDVEAAAYYVVIESLTNVLKHAAAAVAEVRLELADGSLVVLVRDRGRGGARPELGTGLSGLADRLSAVGGTFGVASPPGGGTTVTAVLPVDAEVLTA